MKRRKPGIEVVGDNVAEELTGHDRATLGDMVDELRDGRISRRSFVERSAVFGLSAMSVAGVLAETGAAARRAAPTTSAKLNIGVGQDADTVDPQAFKDIPGYYMLANLYDQLVDLKAKHVGDLLVANPAAPTSMIAKRMVISKDLRTATFHLDPRAKF